MALTMFEGDELAAALGVPFFYGVVEAVLLGVYCVVAWKVGWTKAPKNISIWKALSTSYEIVVQEEKGNDGTILADQELSSNTLPTNVEEEEDDDFHYVQHSDAVPDEEAPKETISDEPKPPSPPPATTILLAAKEPLVAKSGSADQ